MAYRFFIWPQLAPSIYSGFSPCVGLHLVTQSTQLLKNCYPNWYWTHIVPKFFLQSSWIKGRFHCTRLIHLPPAHYCNRTSESSKLWCNFEKTLAFPIFDYAIPNNPKFVLLNIYTSYKYIITYIYVYVYVYIYIYIDIYIYIYVYNIHIYIYIFL